MSMLVHENIGSCKCVEGNTLAKLKPLLEDIHIVGWTFDLESRCKIVCKLEGFNRVFPDVYVVPQANPNLQTRKHMCVVDLDSNNVSQPTLECIVEEVEIQELTPLDDFG